MEKETGEICGVILQTHLGLSWCLEPLHTLAYTWHWLGQQLHNCTSIYITDIRGRNRDQEILVAVPEHGEGIEGCYSPNYRVGMSFWTSRALCWVNVCSLWDRRQALSPPYLGLPPVYDRCNEPWKKDTYFLSNERGWESASSLSGLSGTPGASLLASTSNGWALCITQLVK